MPRSERPLDLSGGPLAGFASGLRRLRDEAGGMPYRRMARLANYSSSSLSEAASGRKLPSLAVTLAFVRTCGGDEAEWETRWRETEKRLAEQDTAAAETTEAACPYVGLATYQPQDASRFYGRDALTRDLVRRVRANRFLAVFGASGSGKSSLLRAGLLPRVRDGDQGVGLPGWPTLLFTPGAHPIQECAVRMAGLGVGLASALHREFTEDPNGLHLAVLHALDGQPPEVDLTLVVDQFEEVFTLCQDEQERVAFLSGLLAAAQAANSRVRVVLGVRADFYAHCTTYPKLVEALRDAQLPVGPMSAAELEQVVTQPAKEVGCEVHSALLARIVDEAHGQAGVLPLVSHALRETWQRRDGNLLTLAAYEQSGGIQHALARSAEQVHDALPAAQRQVARAVLLALVAPGEGTADTKRRVRNEELPGDPDTQAVLAVLADARLITLDADAIELTHEALLHAWPRLRGWIGADRAGIRLRHQLTEDAAAWDQRSREPSNLYRGNRLATAREWAETHPRDVTALSRVFLDAARTAERRTQQLRRAGIAAIAALAVLASLAAAVAFTQRGLARSQANRAIYNQVTAEADQLQDTNPSLAAQLNLAAYQLHPTAGQRADLDTRMLSTQNTVLSAPLAGHSGAVNAVTLTRDGRTLASVSEDHTVRLWNVADLAHPSALGAPLTGHTDAVNSVAFSANGRLLATGSSDRTVRLWNVADPSHASAFGPALTGHTNLVGSVAFRPDGRVLASADDDGTVLLWDVSDPARPVTLGAPLAGHKGIVASVAFSPDGRTLASGSTDRTVHRWDVSDPSHPSELGPPLAGHTGAVASLAFSPDGRTLATGDADTTIRLWDVSEPTRPSALGPALTGHTNEVMTVAFSPDGQTLASASADGTVRLWNLSDRTHPTALGPPLTGHTGGANWVAFGADGHTLVTGGGDKTVRIWDVPRTVLTGHTDLVKSATFSPNGRVLASASSDRTIRLWNVADPNHPSAIGAPLTGHAADVFSVAFSPNGRLLASASADHTVRLWNVADPSHASALGPPLTGHTGNVYSVAFSPDGRLLASSSSDRTIRLWNVADPNHPSAIGAPLTGHTHFVYAVAFAPHGRLLASASADGAIRLWNVTDPNHPSALGQPPTGHSSVVNTVAFSPDGRTLASGGSDATVRLWDVADPNRPSAIGAPLTGHSATVQGVAYSADGRTLASVSVDATVRLWNVADPNRPSALGPPLTGHTSVVNTAAFSGDGRLLASASSDTTVRLWKLDVAGAKRRLCATTRDTLTAAQWKRYVPQPYAPPCLVDAATATSSTP